MLETLSPAIQTELLRNGLNHGGNFVPLAMMKIEGSLQVWLLTELQPDAPHIGWGICDHGIGAPYYGWVDLERTEYKYWEEWGLKAVWDDSFQGYYPYSVYLHAALNRIKNGEPYPGITLVADDLAQAASKLNHPSASPKPPSMKPE